MSSASTSTGEARVLRCLLRVRGRLSPATAQVLDSLSVSYEDGLTILDVQVGPHRGLASVLLDLQALGLEVVDVRRNPS